MVVVTGVGAEILDMEDDDEPETRLFVHRDEVDERIFFREVIAKCLISVLVNYCTAIQE